MDCRELLAAVPEEEIDACITDPPYELGFMGKAWDRTGIAYDVSVWRALLRVLKPGAHLLAFGGTRTYHRMGCAIEDAGFEIRDSLHWLYGTGFPKSKNLGGGLGTALKPGHEPILLARKPTNGTVIENVAAHGTGGLNIDACRNVFVSDADKANAKPQGRATTKAHGAAAATPDAGRNIARIDFPVNQSGLGRWPTNILLDDSTASELDTLVGPRTSGTGAVKRATGTGCAPNAFGKESRPVGSPNVEYGDTGGVSRYFYCTKASRSERDKGCGDLALHTGGELTGRTTGSAGLNNPRAGAGRTSGGRNTHPTVKPIALMRWLVRLITPPDGLVLDPFCGSGSTGIAALLEQRNFLGCDSDPEAIRIAEARLDHWRD
jgi:DNA modification methylase